MDKVQLTTSEYTDTVSVLVQSSEPGMEQGSTRRWGKKLK